MSDPLGTAAPDPRLRGLNAQRMKVTETTTPGPASQGISNLALAPPTGGDGRTARLRPYCDPPASATARL